MEKKAKEIKLPKVEILPSGNCRVRGTINGNVESFTAKTEEEVITKYLIAKQNEKKEVPEERKKSKTLAEAMDEYIHFREKTKSPSTIRGYYIIRENAFQNLMDKKLSRITRQEWQDAIDADVVAGKSAKTIKNRFDLVKSIMKENGMTPPKLSLPSVAKSRDDTEDFVRFLDDKELEVFCKAIRGTEHELMCYLALNSLRCSEVYGMSWDKINLENGKLVIYGAVVPDRSNKLVHKNENKNGTSKRTIPVLFPRLTELVEEADRTKPITAITPNGFYKWVNRICTQNGLKEVGIHGLRHTGASLCVYKGVKKKAIMHWFGWSTPDTLDKIYSHISARQQDLEAEKVLEFTSGIIEG